MTARPGERTTGPASRHWWQRRPFTVAVALFGWALFVVLVVGACRLVSSSNGGGVGAQTLWRGTATISDCTPASTGQRWLCTAPAIAWGPGRVPSHERKLQRPPYVVVADHHLSPGQVPVSAHPSRGMWARLNLVVVNEVIVADGSRVGSPFWDGVAEVAPPVIVTVVTAGALTVIWRRRRRPAPAH